MMYFFRRFWFFSIVILGLGFALSGCAQNRQANPIAKPTQQPIPERGPSAYKIGNPYKIGGAWYYPRANYNYRETGIASWYGPNFHGKSTANGETFDQNALTAAHRTLPMPSMVRVTNLENGRSIKVRINDRGPFKNGRIIDLSRRAADLLGFRRRGTAKVLVEIVEDESRVLAAAALTEDAAKRAPDPAPTVPVTTERLRYANGVPPATQPGTPSASQTALAMPRRVDPRKRPRLQMPTADGIVSTVTVVPSRIFVQAGSFTRMSNAHKLRARLAKIGKAQIAQALVDNRYYFRVRFGPMGSVEAADQLLAVLLDNGHKEARVVVD